MKKRILIVEDNEINRIMLAEIVSAEYEVVTAENGREALSILKQQYARIAVVLLDIVMPVMNGYEFLNEMKKNPDYASIPVIVTTERGSEKEEIAALTCGATEFIVKPYQPAIIMHRIASIIELRKTSAMVYQLQYDRLTGLFSRDYFYQYARELRAKNPDKVYDIICTNVENFHLFNEKYGTATGDKLLQEIAQLYTEVIDDGRMKGEQIVVSHFYADHFVGMMPHLEELNNEAFGRLTEELRRRFRIPNIVIKWGIYTDRDGKTAIEKMCDNATMAARSIKGRYGVWVTRFDKELKETLLREQAVTDEMETALKQEQFEIYLQPKVKNGETLWRDAEALVRWNHPKKGLMSPLLFIPIFEKTRFITKLDWYVWEHTCRLLEKWNRLGYGEINVSVNVSRIDVYEREFLERLEKMVDGYQISRSQLHLEITETAYAENSAEIMELVAELRKAGFVVEMDDFGSGYSSLNMLMQMPIDIVKLDRGLIQNEMKSPGGLTYIIGLAHWLGLKVVAEGIETQEQYEYMTELGCDYIQGYYTARPMPWRVFETYLQEQSGVQ